ncbi:MAG: hypothetical protein HRT65_12580 [Flavobacteriaceae bacterium]|nr:hypothetical protein [Flavobacteriaceae bacterium]
MHRLIPIAFLLHTFLLSAQFGKNCELRQFKINAISLGFEYEMALGVNSTLDFRVALKPSLDPFTENPLENYELFPAITVQNRYYYNFGSRGSRGHQIYGNSANYVAPSVSIFESGSRIVEGAVAEGFFATAGLVTGLQRSYNSGLSFSIDVGAAYFLGPFDGGIYPVANISLGWIISEKRWCVGR